MSRTLYYTITSFYSVNILAITVSLTSRILEHGYPDFDQNLKVIRYS